MVEKIEKIEFTSIKKGGPYEAENKYPAKNKYNRRDS